VHLSETEDQEAPLYYYIYMFSMHVQNRKKERQVPHTLIQKYIIKIRNIHRCAHVHLNEEEEVSSTSSVSRISLSVMLLLARTGSQHV